MRLTAFALGAMQVDKHARMIDKCVSLIFYSDTLFFWNAMVFFQREQYWGVPQIVRYRFWVNYSLVLRYLTFLLLFFLSVSAFCSTKDRQLLGVWSGTVGNEDVRVCFKSYNSSYYRVDQMKGIGLESEKNGRNQWQIFEGPYGQPDDAPRAVWQIKLLDLNTLSGLRTDSDRSKPNLTIHLKRNLVDEKVPDYEKCSTIFYTPLIQATKIKKRDDSFSGKPYIVINSKYGKSFQLPEGDPNARTINALYMKSLDEEVIASYDCEIDKNDTQRGQRWFTYTSPLVWTDEWLVVRYQFEYMCGGAHGGAPRSEQIFDLKSGKQVDSWHWIKGGERAANPNRGDSSGLRKLLHKYGKVARVSPKVNYVGVFDLNGLGTRIENPYPTSRGLVFPTRFEVCRRLLCDVFIPIPYSVIDSYLTEDGKAMAASFARSH